MKKFWILVVLLCMLTGCGSLEAMETLGSISHQSPVIPEKKPVHLQLPAEAAENTWQGEEDTLYVCEDYTISLRTFAAGDLTATVQSLSGYKPEQLTVMQSNAGKVKRYDLVWTAVGENGDMVCRGAVLDDGNYHYSLCVMAEASQCGELAEEWNTLFHSFRMEN